MALTEESRGVYRGFGEGNLREREHLEDPGVDGRIILRWISRKWDRGGMGWVELAQDRGKWWAVVNLVMNLRVSIKCGENFLTGREPINLSCRTLLHGVSK